MKTHPAADAVRVTEAFVAAAAGTHERSKRDPGVAVTRHDRRMLRVFEEDSHDLPTGSLTMEAHLGYRFCNIPGTEVPEILGTYNEIRAHAGTWGFHEQQCKDRCAGLILEGRKFVDDAGEALDGFEAGEENQARLLSLLEGVRVRMARERDASVQAHEGLKGFAAHIHETLAPEVVGRLDVVSGTRHDATAFGLRAKGRRLLGDIVDKEKAYARLVDGDEWNLLGRRFERTLYAQATVDAHEALWSTIYEYKQVIGQVAIPHRTLKSLGLRRVHLANAALAARSAAQGLGHLATLWATTHGAVEELIAELEAAKDAAATKAACAKLNALVTAWESVESLAEVNEDTLV